MIGQSRYRSIWAHPTSIVLLGAVFMGAVDLTVVATILPGMVTDLGINAADIDRYIWVVNSYLIAYVVSIPLFGRVSDISGLRAAFLAASTIFIAGSIVCATSDSLQDLVIGRAVQGFGGGGLLPVAMSATVTAFAGPAKAQAIGAVGAIDTLGWVSGPAYGAVMTTQLDVIETPWRLVFWVNVPIALALMAVAFKLLQAYDLNLQRRPDGFCRVLQRLDLPGFVLLSVFLTSINVALASGGEFGATAGQGLRAFGGTPNPVSELIPFLSIMAVVALVLFVLWTRRSNDPFIPSQLLRRPVYRASALSNFLLGTALMTGMVNVPVIVSLIETSTDTATKSALLLAPFTASIAAFSIVSGRLLATFNTGAVTLGGLLLALVGSVSIYPLLAELEYEWMALGLAIAGAGTGLALTPLSTTALEAASAENRGAAASTLLVFRLLGMTIGVSALTALGVQRLQVLTDQLEPISRNPEESTAEFLLRQQEYILTHAIPLGVQVVQETFLAAALLVALTLIPGWLLLHRSRNHRSES